MSLYDVADEFGNWRTTNLEFGRQTDRVPGRFIGGSSAFRVTSDDDVTVNSVGVATDDRLEIGGGSTLTATNGTVLGPTTRETAPGSTEPSTWTGLDLFDRQRPVKFRDGRRGRSGNGGWTIALNGSVAFNGVGTSARR